MLFVLALALVLVPLAVALLLIWRGQPLLQGGKSALALVFAAGAIVGIPVGLVEDLVQSWLAIDLAPEAPSQLFSTFAFLLIVVGPVEELGKMLVVIPGLRRQRPLARPWRAGEVVLLALASGFGFAIGENVFYILILFAEDDSPGGLALAVIRTILPLPAHLVMSTIWGQALQRGNGVFGAFLLAAIVHGIYDVFASFPGPFAALGFVLCVVILGVCYRRVWPAMSQAGRLFRGRCPICAVDIAAGAAFCPSCGVPTDIECRICGAKPIPFAPFCHYCGAQHFAPTAPSPSV